MAKSVLKNGNTMNEAKCKCGCHFVHYLTDYQREIKIIWHKWIPHITYHQILTCPECAHIVKFK